MAIQRVFKALGCRVRGKERYVQSDAGNITGVCVSVAHRTPTGSKLRVASRREGIAEKLPVFSRLPKPFNCCLRVS
ncbi:hypothetical protein [Nostoc sp. NMS4]|uniref:hypothetical protein n=1 Tax=Nostoc sp. NMS4 TaxID=2815390 RepID=UPI0025E10C29|nr:hypothetical protein [Nostoc sp. NMS4]